MRNKELQKSDIARLPVTGVGRSCVVATFSLVIALLLFAKDGVAQSIESDPIYTQLPTETQQELKKLCLPEQFRSGANGYRSCILSEIANRQSPDTSLLDNLTFDDKYAVQQACAPNRKNDELTTISAYNKCIKQEISNLNQEKAPDLSVLSDNERYAIAQTCFTAQTTQGALAYRKCVNSELESLQQYAPVSLAGLSSVEKNTIQLGCSPSTVRQSAAQYRLCVAESLEVILKKKRNSKQNENNNVTISTTQVGTTQKVSPEIQISNDSETTVATESVSNETATAEPAQSNTQDDASVVTPAVDLVTAPATELTAPTAVQTTGKTRIISRPQTVTVTTVPLENGGNDVPETLGASDNNVDVTVTSVDTTDLVSLDNPASEPFDLVKTLQALNLSKFAPYLKFALPILLGLLVWRVAKLFFSPKVAPRHYNYEQNNTIDFDTIELEPDPADANKQATPDWANDPAGNEWPPSQESPKIKETTILAEPAVLRQTSAFGHWLQKHTVVLQKRYCTEFLLYWISYGDGNFNLEMKEYLLNTTDELIDHDLIKKWVLQQDSNACVDALSYMRENFNPLELEQTLNLLFAVLVKSDITPVQNTFFRFFADAIGVGSIALEKLYQDGFGKPLPSIPRPDDMRWWNRINDDQPIHAKNPIEHASERDAMLARLNLSPTAKDDAVRHAFKRISARYHPAKFSELGVKEKELAERHLQRYSDAYHWLQGETA